MIPRVNVSHTEINSTLAQEPVRTKHPQLLYETKLYRILQGGGKYLGCVNFSRAKGGISRVKNASFWH